MRKLIVCFAMLPVAAINGAEYRGSVRAVGLPLPGATVIATRSGSNVTTTTDEKGDFSFPDLADGDWTIEVQSLGFAKLRRSVTIAPGAGAAAWDLQFLPKEQLLAGLQRKAAQPTPPPPRNPARTERRASAGAPAQESQQQQREFQRLGLTQAAETQTFGNEGTLRAEESAELNQSAANSFIVQGSVSSAVALPQQNDWALGPRGMGMGMEGMPPAGMMGMGGPNGDGPGPQEPNNAPPMGGGRRGFGGGPPGGSFGGPGGRGGSRGGPGGPGAGPGGGSGMRGAGGRGGNRRPEWQGRPDAMAFGNGRRNRRLQYMGMAMFNLNDSLWDARTFSVTGASVAKPEYSNARGGLMFGGPLRIPKLVRADRQIMFTLNYQFGRNRTGTVSDPVNMPTALERIGDFSKTLVAGRLVTIYDPLTNAPFPGNQIPASRINQTSAALLKYFPDPNLPFAARNYQTSWTSASNTHNLNARVMNVRIGAKDRLNGSFGFQDSGTTTPNIFQFIDNTAGRGINTMLGWSRNITTHLTNNVQFAFSRVRQNYIPYFAGLENVAADLGIAGTSQDPINWGPPSLRFTNYATLTDGTFSLNRNQTASFGDSLLWVHGAHNYTVGGNYRRFQTNQLADSNGRGSWTFNGLSTSLMLDGVQQAGTGYDLADFLLGAPTTSSIRYGNPDKYFRNSGVDLFVNDDWRIHPRFSLNAGVRWDYVTPVGELYGRLTNLAIDPGFSAIRTVTANGLIHPDRNNISPRIGIAWRPSAAGSAVVRAGYGVYYNTSVYNIIAANMAQQPPFAQVLNVSNTPLTPLSVNQGFALASDPFATSTYAIDPSYRIGYAQTWSASVQHDLPFGMFGTIGYLGTKGTRLDQQFLPNTAPPGMPQSNLPHGFLYENSNGNSIYHAAQFQLNRRFRTGLGWGASYQLSKSIDNAGTGGRGQGNTPVAQNWLDYSAERALSSFDSRHNLSIQAQYSTGMGRAGGTLIPGWRGAFLKDWTISSMLTARSGNPFTALVGGSLSQVAGTAVNNTVRANATGLPIDADGMLFNTAAFTVPVAGQWGSAGRNTIPGPTTVFLNSGVGRVFRFGERRSLDIQLQGQNVLNRVTITNWGTVVGANNFGLATSAAAMRRVTLSMRFRF